MAFRELINLTKTVKPQGDTPMDAVMQANGYKHIDNAMSIKVPWLKYPGDMLSEKMIYADAEGNNWVPTDYHLTERNEVPNMNIMLYRVTKND